MARSPDVVASSIVVPPGMGRPREGVYRPARPRIQCDDSVQLDVTTLAVYGVGVPPTPIDNLGTSTGIIVPGGAYGGLLFSLSATPPRPMAGVIGRPIWRLNANQLFAWQTSKGWGEATLEFFEWRDDENPHEQLDQILKWSTGTSEPTVDVTATVSTPSNRKTTVVDRAKGALPAAFALQPNNVGTTIRNRSTLSGGGASIGNLYIATDALELAALDYIELGPGQFAAGVPGALYFDNGEAVTFEVIEALA